MYQIQSATTSAPKPMPMEGNTIMTEKLLKLLAQKGCVLSEAELSGILGDRTLNEQNIEAIAEAILASQASLALAGNSKPTSAKGKRGKVDRSKKNERTASPGEAIANAFNQIGSEVSGLKAGIIEARDAFVEEEAQALMDEVAETPNLVLIRFATLASQHKGDPDHFRTRSKAFGTALFGSSGAIQAE